MPLKDPIARLAYQRRHYQERNTRTTRRFQFSPEYFWQRVRKTETCWLWMGSKNRDGYGVVQAAKKRLAHRIAWELTHGSIPVGISVLHHCDVPSCVNPACLFLGTHQDNMTDMVTKNRHPRKTLTEDNVREIRACWLVMANQSQLARQFGVLPATVNKVINRQTWRHVHDDDGRIP